MAASEHPNDQHDDLALLAALLDMPVDHTSQLAPVALRSVAVQREDALRGFLRRTWVDRTLRHAERGLLVGALLIFGGWLADGPVRDWLYARNQQATVAGAAPAAPAAVPPLQPSRPPAAPATAPPVATQAIASLPFVSDEMERAAPAEAFIAPRQSAPKQPAVVSPLPTRLLAPAIALDSAVKETFVVDGAWEVADYAAGYMNGTALPGENGNTALAGHAGIRGAVFRDLGTLKPGDDVYLDAGGWRYHYRVRATSTVLPTQIEVIAPTSTPVLTLLTCTNWDTQRLVVVADLVDSQPSPGA